MNKKIKILDIFYICIILNLIPVAMLGIFKIPHKIYTLLYALVYIIQCFLLFSKLSVNLKKISKNQKILLSLLLINGIITILFDFLKFKSFSFNEVLFIVSFFINILFLIIGVSEKKISNDELCIFLKRLCFLGIVSVIINIFINFKDFFNIFSIDNSYDVNFSSFFPNRNQYGLFMLIMIMSLSLLINIKYEKKYIFLFIIFSLSLFLTMSRNSILGLLIFSSMFFYYKYIIKNKIIQKKKFFLYLLILIIFLALICFFTKGTKFQQIINTFFLRYETLKSGSGRINVWKNAFYIIFHNNILFGVGRYKALELNLLLFNNELTHFHSIYIEKFVTHGLLGLFILFVLLRFVWHKVSNMNECNINKYILKSSLIAFLIVSSFETTTRFSIGYTDFMFTFFFFSLPILISNSEKK